MTEHNLISSPNVDIGKLEFAIRVLYPKGVTTMGVDANEALDLLKKISEGLGHALEQSGSDFRLFLDLYEKREGQGLVVFDHKSGETHVVSITIKHHVVWVRGRPIYVKHPAGPPALLKAIWSEVSGIVTADGGEDWPY